MSDSVPGFRFFPTEEELISFYLKRRLENQGVREDLMDLVIPVLNIYDFAPSDLQQHSGVRCRGDPEQWFFFIPRQECESRGGRPSRLTESGYWKATGSPSYVYSSDSRVIGLKRTMVFYTGRAPQGNKTHWKMNEYKAIEGEVSSSSSSSHSTPMLRQEFSLCRVYKKTKCISAFDRRPIAAAGIAETQANNNHMNPQIMDYQLQNDYNHDHNLAAASTMRTPHHITTTAAPAAERTSSLDGSTAISSPEDGGGGPTQAFNDQDLAAGDEPFWLDWDFNFGGLNYRMVEEE